MSASGQLLGTYLPQQLPQRLPQQRTHRNPRVIDFYCPFRKVQKPRKVLENQDFPGFFTCHTPTIWIFQNFTQASRTAPHRPSGRRRECAVQAFSPQAKTLAQGEFISPEHFKSKGGGRLGRPKPQKKDMTHGHAFLLGRDG